MTRVYTNSVSYNGFPSSLMLFLVEIINATFLFGVLLKLVGHPDSNSAIMFSFNLDRLIRIDLVCRVNTCNDIQLHNSPGGWVSMARVSM